MNKIIILFIITFIAYSGLSAQTSKGFNETVILRNGAVLAGVKAAVPKESLVVHFIR